MKFLFPESCPVCSRSSCVGWKGYYIRSIQDVAFGFRSVAIRHGRCRYQKRNFSLLPDFLISRIRLTRRSIKTIQASFEGRRISMQAALDTCFSPWHERNRVPVSTAHFALRRYVFDVWWAKAHEQRDALMIRRRRVTRLSKPKSFGSVLTRMCPRQDFGGSETSVEPRTRGPPRTETCGCPSASFNAVPPELRDQMRC